MEHDLKQALTVLNCAVFKYLGSGQFAKVFNDLPWIATLLPNLPASSTSLHMLGNSLFLDDFIRDAKSFWHQQQEAQLNSGIWTEPQADGQAKHYEAQAINCDAGQYLIIKNLASEFDEKQKTLQLARELVLANENIVANHQYAQERLAALVAEPESAPQLIQSVSKVVQMINTAILICDNDMQCILDNPATRQLFNPSSLTQGETAISTLLALIEKQYPEFQFSQLKQQAWQGELCWMRPPFTMKWLMVSAIPVSDGNSSACQWIFIISDITQLKHLQEQNEKLTLIDHLTELPNRQFFWNALDTAIARNYSCYVLFIDIEHFRVVNDELGHRIGDEVLLFIAEQLRSSIKNSDIVARIGGDEFGILLYGIESDDDCEQILSRLIRSTLHLPNHIHEKINQVSLTLKIGAAAYPRDGQSVERLIKCANIATNHTKQTKGLAYSFYNAEMELDMQRMLTLKKEIDLALEHNQFELYFQPIYAMPTKTITKAEVLIRWHHPELGLVSPASFIPLAEESGLIIHLGKWIFEQACQALSELHHQGHQMTLAVNLSPRQFSDRNLATFIEETIAAFNIAPENIELEVTEGLLIYNFDSVLAQLTQLRKIGVKLSVDDFGTGYSSLSYLKRLPINTLKVDRSFVIDLATDNSDKAIVSAVISMAHELNLAVVAEGVEQESQLQFLLAHHCDFIQGFLFCQPLPFDKLCQQLASPLTT
ncbi:putative bifunctional diguanylate cyclase/phosphodiesterase [Thalassotalea euphylliae]|uniref:cyclic-guanylate-specific phosphodiesterase n=1 Tax=Thalassotalea euphylliae TaxID=1655234 RepID=A0A3E0U121_9GAMM|nr:EAL domain-containing protein [Thalassotalea euphylliae]REL30399.1 EAL domain-containing protein [Thalassotalea euphylliae]